MKILDWLFSCSEPVVVQAKPLTPPQDNVVKKVHSKDISEPVIKLLKMLEEDCWVTTDVSSKTIEDGYKRLIFGIKHTKLENFVLEIKQTYCGLGAYYGAMNDMGWLTKDEQEILVAKVKEKFLALEKEALNEMNRAAREEYKKRLENYEVA